MGAVTLCRDCADQGQCCRYITLPLAEPWRLGPKDVSRYQLARNITADEKHFVELHRGLSVQNGPDGAVLTLMQPMPHRIIPGQPGMPDARAGSSIRVDVPCGALFEGKCALFGTPDRPTLCSDWPDQLEQIETLNGCAYQSLFINKESLSLAP